MTEGYSKYKRLVFLNNELENFRKFFYNDKKLTTGELKRILYSAGITPDAKSSQGYDLYNPQKLKACRSGNSAMKALYDAYWRLREEQDHTPVKPEVAKPQKPASQNPKPVQLSLNLTESELKSVIMEAVKRILNFV